MKILFLMTGTKNNIQNISQLSGLWALKNQVYLYKQHVLNNGYRLISTLLNIGHIVNDTCIAGVKQVSHENRGDGKLMLSNSQVGRENEIHYVYFPWPLLAKNWLDYYKEWKAIAQPTWSGGQVQELCEVTQVTQPVSSYAK